MGKNPNLELKSDPKFCNQNDCFEVSESDFDFFDVGFCFS
jgi:hypothetical protein